MAQKDIVHKFDSLHACIEYASGESDMPEEQRSSRKENEGNWSGSKSFEDACELALHGWSEVRPKVDMLTDKLNMQVRETIHTAFQPVYDVQGAMVDVGAYLSGEPECMVDFLPIEQSRVGRVVTVIAQTCVSGSVSAETIMARGAALAALVEALAVAQHSTELWVEISTGWPGSDKGYWALLVKVKEANERFDIDAFSFALAHPSMLRRIMFSCIERENAATRKRFNVGRGYGRAIPECTQADEVGATVVIAGTGPSARDLDRDPVKWIKGILGDLGLGQDEEEKEG